MNKVIRKIKLLFKSISIHLETRRLKKEIKDAYSDGPSKSTPKMVGIAVLSLITLGSTFYVLTLKRGKKGTVVKTEQVDLSDKKDNTTSGAKDNTAKNNATKANIQSTKKSVAKVDAKKNATKTEIVKKKYATVDGDSTLKHMLVADKGDKIIHLFEREQSGWFLRRTFPVASGAKTGKKEVSGDLRTPEGIYFIEGRKEGDSLNEIYGPLAYVLNYPNRHDVAAGRTGNGIWIHGTTPGEVPVDTKGCLELHNDNLIKLSKILGKGDMVPVIIHSKEGAPFDSVVNINVVLEEHSYIINRRTAAEIRLAELDSLKSFVRNWATLWETMEIDSYALAYDTVGFKVAGYNWQKWKTKKINTFKRYSSIDIDVSKIDATLESDSTAVVVFDQVYTSNLFRSENKKRLSMRKIENQWKITAEVSLP